ncbi:MAG TPA: pirin family protein [Thermoanaerobaculia bacterium]|nr:pirin family protein [Thermoanaerobaculia bacterium]
MKSRSVRSIAHAVATLEGAGFLVHRPFPTPGLDHIDPFLLLDEMGPSDLAPGEARGAPDHPHRGFETVTYMLDGKMEHRDSHGNAGSIGPGDVQWMTAGSGVIHSEMPAAGLLEKGGRVHGFQLWVNLPRRDKMMTPRYQEVPSSKIPTATSPDGGATVKVLAGESLGTRAVIDTRTPILYLDVSLKPGAALDQPVPQNFNVFAYVVDGSGVFGQEAKAAGNEDAVIFRSDGEGVSLKAASGESLRVLLIGGAPLDEPVARYGPFVMNTRHELIQAVEDFQSGRFGEIPPAS